MFLQPSEVGFLKHLKEARVPLVEFEFPTKRIFNIQSQLEKLIGQNYYLNRVGSFSSFLLLNELILFVTVGKGWLPLVSPGICFPQPSINFRRSQA